MWESTLPFMHALESAEMLKGLDHEIEFKNFDRNW